MSFQNTVGPDG